VSSSLAGCERENPEMKIGSLVAAACQKTRRRNERRDRGIVCDDILPTAVLRAARQEIERRVAG
jgi:hypothetical protein